MNETRVCLESKFLILDKCSHQVIWSTKVQLKDFFCTILEDIFGLD